MGDNDEFTNNVVDQGLRIHGGKGRLRGLPITFDKNNVSTKLEYFGVAQDYSELKAQLLEDGVLFEDPEFPAEESSIFYSGKSIGDVEWKRPSEIVEDPRFFVEGGSRFDVKQGQLGDCWLLAAIANLTLNERLFHIVVPEDNSFISDYCGIFHFRFWQYGDWVDVVVDDLLPTQDGRLCFMHSDTNNEFWSALLEKAYAKLHGTYEALVGGLVCEALVDFTGGITEMYELGENRDKMLETMGRAQKWCSFMGCSLNTSGHSMESETSEGLIRGHAYSITRLAKVDLGDSNVSLVRVRNPWGNHKEWKGAWSDESEEWLGLGEDVKESLGLTFDSDGEFWMSYDDFSELFDSLEICNLSAHDFVEGTTEGMGWEVNKFEGGWVRGATAGSCRNNLQSFACNTQYTINLEIPDEDDEDGKCTVLISLMQKNRRQMRKEGRACLPIGFVVYALPEEEPRNKPLGVNFFRYNQSVARSQYINLREVCCRVNLDPGTYVIIPTTFNPNEEGDFLLRVFSEAKATMEENDDELGIGEVDERVGEISDDDEQMKIFRTFFMDVAGEDGDVDWEELKSMLDRGSPQEFSKDVSKSLLALMDKNMTGKLDFGEFQELVKNLVLWQKVFALYDEDTTGNLSTFELRQALGSAGYHFNNEILKALALRYGDKEGLIPFNDFIACAVKLKAMIDTFTKKSEGNEGQASFTMEEWLTSTLYC